MNNYNNTVNYLYGLQKHGIKLGLANIRKLISLLKEPQKSFNSIHIAGTNGKGSTACAIASILADSGYSVGLFTSPHLVSFTERIRVNNQQITEDEVIQLASTVRESISGTDLNPTFFEFVTAMAFHYFASRNVDWAVVETGMGGRLDATNVLTPDLTIITNISLDHSEFLGETISDITFEKAGIIKPGVPLITSSLNPDVIKQLTVTAEKMNSAVHVYGKDYSGLITAMDKRHMRMNYSGYSHFENLVITVTGKHQLYNISMALRACEILSEKGFRITESSIRNGLKYLGIEGRLEFVPHSPPIILDSAHNPEAARSLADSLNDMFPGKKFILVAGIMDDKDISGILNPLSGLAGAIILTKPGYSRAASPEKLNRIISDLKENHMINRNIDTFTTGSVRNALDLAKASCGSDDIILVTGSFYTSGEVKEILGRKAVLSDLREKK